MKKLTVIILLAVVIIIFPQQSNLSKGVNYLSEFIASDHFNELKNKNTDIELVDTIYNRAVKFYDYDYSEALLALTFTTIPYNKIPIVIPLINEVVYFPLTSAREKIYLKKNENLPTQIFFDTPQTKFGDRDKLAHFFGNAFIAYHPAIFDLAEVFGYFVEAFEEDFKVQSKIDERDLITNSYGIYFGDYLENDKSILPSSVLILRTVILFRFSFP